MATKTWTPGTVIDSAWLQDVNDFVYKSGYMRENATGGPLDAGDLRIRRRANYSSGGITGYVNSALFVDTFAEATASSFEWAGVFVMHNYSPNGENVGLYRQGIKYSGAGPTWAGTDEIIDWNTDPASGVVGVELSFTANGTDVNSARVGYDMALRKRDNAGASPVAGWGFRIQTQAGSKFVRGFSFTSGSTADIGFDTSLGVMNTAAFKMSEGQPIIFMADDSRKLFYSSGAWRFTDASNSAFAEIKDNNTFVLNGLQVVRERITGWANATGTATRTTFATSTVTTEQLAERVKALVDDLTLHGLIGA